MPKLREHYINKICYEKSIKENLDFWGCFSINYKSKMNISGIEILNKIKQNEGYDIYFFNPFYSVSACFYNVWENLHFHNQKSIKVLENIFPILEIDLKNLYEPMNTDEMFYCCYFVANKKFWDEYNTFFSKYFESLNKLDDETKKIYYSSFKYPKDNSLDFFPFIHERFFSYFIKNKNFKTFSFHFEDKRNHNDKHKECDELRKNSILQKDKSKLKEWINKRSLYYNMENNFVNLFYKNVKW